MACSDNGSSVLTLNALNLGIQKIKDVELTGIPTAPTAFIGTSTSQVATTAFVLNQVAQITTGDGDITTLSSFTGGTTGLTPNIPTTGNISLAGVLNKANGGTGATTLPGAGIVTITDAQAITGAKEHYGSFSLTTTNPYPAFWPGYSRSKQDNHPSFVFDGGNGANPISAAFLGVSTSNPVTFCSFNFGSPFVGLFSQVGFISSSGSNTTYSTTSDYRLKENIVPMVGALDKVTQLKPVTYTWKSTGVAEEGFIAHELAEVCPQAVTGKKDELSVDGTPKYQGVDTSFLVAMLTSAIQEQQALITNLTNRITALENV